MKRLLLIAFLTAFAIGAQAQTGKMAPAAIGVQTPILRSFPNPATTVINFSFQKEFEKGYSIQVYNFLGRKMSEQAISAEQVSINLTDFTRGVYIYKLFDKNGRLVETGKFTVSK